MEKHDDIRLLISGYFDGEISAEEKQAVEAHLSKCPECQKYFNDLQKMSSSLKSWTNETLSLDSEQKIKTVFEKSKEGTKMNRTFALRTTGSLVIVVGVVAVLFHTYTQQRMVGRLKQATDEIASLGTIGFSTVQYEPYYLKSDYDKNTAMVAGAQKVAGKPAELTSLSAGSKGQAVQEYKKVVSAKSASEIQSNDVASIEAAPMALRGTGGVQQFGYEQPIVTVAPPMVQTLAPPQAAGMAMPKIYQPVAPSYYGNTEEYGYTFEEGFRNAQQNTQSTFSIDVDTASRSEE